MCALNTARSMSVASVAVYFLNFEFVGVTSAQMGEVACVCQSKPR